MKVYLVRGESGAYSDWTSVIEAAFSTREAAERYIESKEYSFIEDEDGDRFEFWADELEPGERVVTASPTRHGESWYVDRDCTYDMKTWFVDELEVRDE